VKYICSQAISAQVLRLISISIGFEAALLLMLELR